MNNSFPELKYLLGVVAILLLIFSMVFDLSGRRQREIDLLEQEMDQARAIAKKESYRFDVRDRLNQELHTIDAEYEMIQQLASPGAEGEP